MGMNTVQGIVLRHAPWREHDRLLTLLTPGGRMEAVAYGCRRPRSPLVACSEVFTLGTWDLASMRGHLRVSGCSITDSFYDLRLDYDKYARAGYMATLCEAVLMPGEDARQLFLLFARVLQYLCYEDFAPDVVLGAFLTRFASIQGYEIALDNCVHCGKNMNTAPRILMDIEQGGVCCAECASRVLRGTVLAEDEMQWIRLARRKAVRDLPAASIPLSFLKAYAENRLEKRVPGVR